jgi:7-carboxy-7-deazaguanine synthase
VNNTETLIINEIFYSIQGESTFAGKPCVFIRLSGCDLRCSYCDTQYAYDEGEKMTLAQISEKVTAYNCKLVEITGGEPLLQENVYPLMRKLCGEGYEVLLETGGQRDIAKVDERVKRIMDIKCPSSGESGKNRYENIALLNDKDEVKFVVGNEEDYRWAVRIIKKYKINDICTVLFAPVYGVMNEKALAEWILEDGLPNVRMQLQLHKYIWPAEQRGV